LSGCLLALLVYPTHHQRKRFCRTILLSHTERGASQAGNQLPLTVCVHSLQLLALVLKAVLLPEQVPLLLELELLPQSLLVRLE
jgi:hypothetical protein